MKNARKYCNLARKFYSAARFGINDIALRRSLIIDNSGCQQTVI